MATAEELLAGVTTVDKTLIISNDLRTISIPSTVANLGVESDNDILRLNFKMPRYIGDIDLSTFSIRINYVNAQGESDVYTVSDATTTADHISFSWLVGPTATRYKGETRFNVCLVKLTSDGEYVDREFNTTVATMKVLEGLEVDESLVEEYSDLIEQWRRELFGIGDTEEAKIKAASEVEQEAIANKGAEVLATIPADYATAVSMTDNAERTKADAIICSTQGEVIAVTDSSDDYLRGLKIFGRTTQVTTTGKNLFEHTQKNATVNGVTLTVNDDGSITANGICTANSIIKIGEFNFTAGESYILTGCPAGGSDTTYRMDLRADSDVLLLEYGEGATITPDIDTMVDVHIRFQGDNTVISNKRFYPMIRLASVTDATYEPYSGGVASPSPEWPQELSSVDNPTTYICGTNLADMPDCESVITDGITWTCEDGVVTAIGTSTAISASAGYFIPVVAGKYFVSGDTANAYVICSIVRANGTREYYHNNMFVLDGTETSAYVYCQVSSGVTLNERIYPMVNRGSKALSWVKPQSIQALPTSHTLPGIPVTSGGNYTNSNGQQWICDEIDFERGVYIQRIGQLTLDGSEAWAASTAADGYYRYIWSGLRMIYGDLTYHLGMNTHFRQRTDETHGAYEYLYLQSTTSGGNLYIQSTKFASVDELCAWLNENNVSIIYQLATPIETPLTAEEITAFQFAHTNFPNTTVLNDAGATMELKYNADTKIWFANYLQTTINDWLKNNLNNAEGVSF